MNRSTFLTAASAVALTSVSEGAATEIARAANTPEITQEDPFAGY